MLEPKIQEKVVANVEVRNVFKFDKATVAGCYVLEGRSTATPRSAWFRDGIGHLSHRGRRHRRTGFPQTFKDDVKGSASAWECGLTIKNYNDLRVGDVVEAYEEEEVKRTLYILFKCPVRGYLT